jgi:protein-S-isoprenylcysteine O-methyltransferase Ste14
MSSSLPPAGWYPDPEGSFRQRWWSGTDWTNDFAQYRPTQIHHAPAKIIAQLSQASNAAHHGAAGVDGVASGTAATYANQPSAQADAYRATPPRPPELPTALSDSSAAPTLASSAVQTLERATVVEQSAPLSEALVESPSLPTFGAATVGAPTVALVPVAKQTSSPAFTVNPSVQSSYEPFSRRSEIRQGRRIAPEVRLTFPSWIVALVPVLALATAIGLAFSFSFMATQFANGIIALGYLLIGFGLAVWDHHILGANDHVRPASAAWALITPLPYLIARSARVKRETGRSAIGPVVLLLLTVVASVGFALWQPNIIAAIVNAPLA